MLQDATNQAVLAREGARDVISASWLIGLFLRAAIWILIG